MDAPQLTPKQLRESPLSTIKLADLKHVMSSVGEKMTEDLILLFDAFEGLSEGDEVSTAAVLSSKYR